MALSRSSHRVFGVLSAAGISAIAFAGITLAPRTAHAQRYYVYSDRPAPPPPAYGYGYGYGPRRAYYSDREAAQALQLGVDLEGAFPVGVNVPGSVNSPNGGGGFKLRIGEQFRFPGVRLTPEVGYAYDHLWASDDSGNLYGWDNNRVFAGARVSFGRILVPVVYAHVGYGWRELGAGWRDALSGGNSGLAYDVGGALDLRVVPHFGFGAHLEYAAIDIPYQPQWVALGLHADFIF